MKSPFLLSLCAAGAVLVAISTAEAGGFAVREQSTSAQGASFAGAAAGFDLSSMFWNPAAVTVKRGVNSEIHGAIVLGRSELTATGGTLNNPALGASGSGNIVDPALIPASYANYQFGNFYVGLSVNAPFGHATKPEQDWRGQVLGHTSRVKTINAAPTVGYKIMPGLAIAAGAQIQYIDARLTSVVARVNPAVGELIVEGDDWGFGFTAGILVEPGPDTKIGLGFRSAISHTLEGSQSSGIGRSSIAGEATLPELVTFSVRQKINPRLAFLGTVEWSNWSRVKTVPITCTALGGACTAAGVGGTLSALEFNYQDGWFFAGGIEYAVSPELLLRTGFAYEISPAREDTSRTVRIADNDRIWASIGVTYDLNATTSLDLAYTHIFVKDGGTDQSTPTGQSLTADVESSADIVSASLKFKW